MALRLKIVSDNAAAAGDHPRWTFGVNGGRIGRNSSNDWVLRDPDRRRRLEDAARQLVVTHYDWAAVADQFETALTTVRRVRLQPDQGGGTASPVRLKPDATEVRSAFRRQA